MAETKKKKTPENSPPSPKTITRAYRPENCLSHKFVVEDAGRVDMLASHEVTDDSVCFNCGLYFSTWVWYSEKINEAYWKGADSEAGQTINYVAKELATSHEDFPIEISNGLLEKLRNRRKKNGKRV